MTLHKHDAITRSRVFKNNNNNVVLNTYIVLSLQSRTSGTPQSPTQVTKQRRGRSAGPEPCLQARSC